MVCLFIQVEVVCVRIDVVLLYWSYGVQPHLKRFYKNFVTYITTIIHLSGLGFRVIVKFTNSHLQLFVSYKWKKIYINEILTLVLANIEGFFEVFFLIAKYLMLIFITLISIDKILLFVLKNRRLVVDKMGLKKLTLWRNKIKFVFLVLNYPMKNINRINRFIFNWALKNITNF